MTVARALAVPYVVMPRQPGTVVIRLPEPGNPHAYYESTLTRREAVRLAADLLTAIDSAEDVRIANIP